MGQEYPGGYNYGQSYDAAWLGQEPSFSQGESDHNIQLTPPEIRRQSFPVPPPHLDRILPPALDTDSNPIGDIVFSNEPRTKISDSVQTISRNKVLNNPVNDYTILFNSTPEAVLNQEFGEDLRKKGEGGWHSNLLVEDMDSSSTSRDHDTPQEDDNQDCSEVSSDQRNARQTRNLTNNISLANSRCHASQIASLNTSTSSPKISESATSEISAEAFIEDRFAYVLQSARKCGFDSLEAMITTYYVSDFSDNPALANAQRLGRNRQLPGIIAGLRGSIDSWSTWEAQGCKEEVLKFSEQVLLNEYRGNARSHDLRRFLGTLNGLDRKGVPEDEHSRKEHVSKVGKLYQDEVSPSLSLFPISHSPTTHKSLI
ncbi:hypothetical protein GLAREA_02895 [Glarea lozoyensis ATCC 20868]|uniref:Uncharacterized protein n=1 Tax=Glarea lozoyensis (strain ATCC 20868 / MF5171) TaxID=1116229 RepID=S3D4H5_GLAL2|nr:uncharacterized protein GLAREA_02895 [Glarea lozoyensis ATCC 20868]EPE26981.1 hypothetical protein GLAREA_02895 [Glarea lozoyensis ATCC 20868]